MWRVYDTGEPFHASEHPAAIDQTGDGELEMAYFDLVYQASRDADGAVDGILMLGVDVTAEVLARRQLERAMAVRRVPSPRPATTSGLRWPSSSSL
jgi:hypothetical protein